MRKLISPPDARRRVRRALACLAASAFFFVFASATRADSPFRIDIVYPAERSSLPAIERIFVYGSVQPPDAQVWINGIDTPMVRTSSGGWLAIIPVKEGKFKVVAKAVLLDGSETVDIHTITFAKGAGVRSVSAQPDLGTLAVHQPPAEKDLTPPKIARVLIDTVFLRSGPNVADEQAGYEMRLQKNVLLTLTGQVDKMYRVRLSDLESVWVDVDAVTLLPKNTPEPQSMVNAWTARRRERATLLSTSMHELLPYRLSVSPDGQTLTLRIYGGISNTDWFHYASGDPWIRHAVWRHPLQNVYELEITLRRPVWGYDIRYEYSRLVIELRDPPAALPAPAPVFARGRDRDRSPVPPLHGVRVMLDPGHPPLGTTSPYGVSENVANWQIADQLRDALILRGADVFMTRNDGETLALPERVIRSRAVDADMFVSIHTNALAPHENPFERNGFGVYYFQSFSQPLAESVHSSLRRLVPLRDDGLHYGNLHVLRQTFSPSILVECGYLMWPPEADKLMDPNFQSVIAQSIAGGIESFVSSRRDSR